MKKPEKKIQKPAIFNRKFFGMCWYLFVVGKVHDAMAGMAGRFYFLQFFEIFHWMMKNFILLIVHDAMTGSAWWGERADIFLCVDAFARSAVQ